MKDWLEAGFTTSGVEGVDVPIRQAKHLKHLITIARGKAAMITKSVSGHITLQAPAVVRARHKCLLQVVTNERRQNWMTPAPDPVATHHCDSCFTIQCNWG